MRRGRSPRTARNALLIVSIVSFIWSARRALQGEVSRQEEHLFRVFNDASDSARGEIWMVMQLGSFGAIPVVAALAGLRSGRRTGAVLGAAGLTAWLLGKLAKSVVRRGRPSDHLADVKIRGTPQAGLGYPSGHAAVALTLALAATSRWPTRILAVSAAGVAAGGRIYSGAHLPLDVSGGLALGVIVGSIASSVRRGDCGGLAPLASQRG